MKLRWIVVAALAAALPGCQDITYQKAGATPQQVAADRKACDEYQQRRLRSMGGDYVENMDRDEFEKPCMEALGYRQVRMTNW